MAAARGIPLPKRMVGVEKPDGRWEVVDENRTIVWAGAARGALDARAKAIQSLLSK
jgi:hypothetical protein